MFKEKKSRNGDKRNQKDVNFWNLIIISIKHYLNLNNRNFCIYAFIKIVLKEFILDDNLHISLLCIPFNGFFLRLIEDLFINQIG